MKTIACFGIAITALAITIQASPASAKVCYDHVTGKGYWCAPAQGFGSHDPVTLPPDRHVSKGTDTGIPVRSGTVFQPQRYPIQPRYFRPS